MLTLAIETSNPAAPGAGVALMRAGQLVAQEALKSGRRHDDALMPGIDRLCRGAKVMPKDIGRVAVSIGPGGYTSLRIACATAKMLCEVTGAECVAVPTAAALRAQVNTQGTVFVALSYKRSDMWVHRFGDGAGPGVGDAGLKTFAELGESLQEGATLVAEQAIVDLLVDNGADMHGVSVVASIFDAHLVARASDVFAPISPDVLVPLYGREPEAVTKWRALHGERGKA